MPIMLLCGYTPFRSDDRRQTRGSTCTIDNLSDEGTPRIIDKLVLRQSTYLTLDSGTQQQRASSARHSIQTPRAALQPTRRSRIRSSQTSRRRPNMTYAAGARTLTRAHGDQQGASHHNDRLTISSDEEDDDGGGESTSWRATPGSDKETTTSQQQQRPQLRQQYLSPPSPDDRPPRRGPAELAPTGTSPSSSIIPDVDFRGDQHSQNLCGGRKERGCT